MCPNLRGGELIGYSRLHPEKNQTQMLKLSITCQFSRWVKLLGEGGWKGRGGGFEVFSSRGTAVRSRSGESGVTGNSAEELLSNSKSVRGGEWSAGHRSLFSAFWDAVARRGPLAKKVHYPEARSPRKREDHPGEEGESSNNTHDCRERASQGVTKKGG